MLHFLVSSSSLNGPGGVVDVAPGRLDAFVDGFLDLLKTSSSAPVPIGRLSASFSRRISVSYQSEMIFRLFDLI